MPSFSDSIFLFILALLLFGPKKLPVLARELGKWVGEFRRASNEFKMQMEEELRLSEQEERRKQIAAMEAAAPLPAPVNEPAEPEHPHLQPLEAANSAEQLSPARQIGEDSGQEWVPDAEQPAAPAADKVIASSASLESAPPSEPLPIATSGELRMMPPATGLPTPRSRSSSSTDAGSNGALSTLVSSIPHDESTNGNGALSDSESATHSR